MMDRTSSQNVSKSTSAPPVHDHRDYLGQLKKKAAENTGAGPKGKTQLPGNVDDYSELIQYLINEYEMEEKTLDIAVHKNNIPFTYGAKGLLLIDTSWNFVRYLAWKPAEDNKRWKVLVDNFIKLAGLHVSLQQPSLREDFLTIRDILLDLKDFILIGNFPEGGDTTIKVGDWISSHFKETIISFSNRLRVDEELRERLTSDELDLLCVKFGSNKDEFVIHLSEVLGITPPTCCYRGDPEASGSNTASPDSPADLTSLGDVLSSPKDTEQFVPITGSYQAVGAILLSGKKGTAKGEDFLQFLRDFQQQRPDFHVPTKIFKQNLSAILDKDYVIDDESMVAAILKNQKDTTSDWGVPASHMKNWILAKEHVVHDHYSNRKLKSVIVDICTDLGLL